MSIARRIRERTNRFFYERKCAEVRSTAPLKYRQDPAITVASMVGRSTLDMYLVAIKSFMVYFAEANVEVISDGSLTEGDKALLSHHIPGIAFSESKAIDTGKCPSYSSWKRLFRIIELCQSSYVVQLDSDTITNGPLVEIYRKAKTNEGFMIGESFWSEAPNVHLMQSIAQRWTANGPQGFSEQVLCDLPFFEPTDTYLHGCAGFAGYARGSMTSDLVEDLSLQIEQRIGHDNWHTWGSEQAITNCLISKTKNASTLPWPKYRNYMFPPTNDPILAATFVHYIGTYRFVDTSYQRTVENFLEHYRGLTEAR